MVFFEGGMTYADLMDMPIPELSGWIDVANRISKETQRAMENARSDSR